ncbi:hypothetical protein BO70DRAFT_110347 [Aspergillus heteromorphus CBS 117.55]|uniref:Uncharacterized protein n=1 Tax=Aspergillus heteromorphus CBS 117.55 TaxID=1448321 RepID=A0A317VH72_9EURO|nr:uncharacterized protein BO70DRAFT_110347 [Aspergillus heteromorphus CBS 117.55]PWY73663.1 hypothetical protein BO70DRAFT_110347 [Aspergillus heteromorphus CBS 117.55]
MFFYLKKLLSAFLRRVQICDGSGSVLICGPPIMSGLMGWCVWFYLASNHRLGHVLCLCCCLLARIFDESQKILRGGIPLTLDSDLHVSFCVQSRLAWRMSVFGFLLHHRHGRFQSACHPVDHFVAGLHADPDRGLEASCCVGASLDGRLVDLPGCTPLVRPQMFHTSVICLFCPWCRVHFLSCCIWSRSLETREAVEPPRRA